MKKIRLIILLVLPVIAMAQTGEKNFIDQNYIEVTGNAEMAIVPDQIFIKIILDENDSKGRIPLAELERSMADRLTELGIDIENDLSIIDFTSSFNSYLFGRGDIQLTKEYMLEVHDASLAVSVFLELETLGISNVSIDRLDHSEIERFRQEVKENAIIAAKRKASSLAEAIDQSIGRAIYIREIEMMPQPSFESNFLFERNLVIPDEMPNVEFEEIILNSSIQVRFELQ